MKDNYCIYCDSDSLVLMTCAHKNDDGTISPETYYMQCSKCGTRTAEYESGMEALTAWFNKDIV